MEFLLLLVIVPIAWLMLLPGRMAKRTRAFRLPVAGMLAVGAVAVWIGLQVFAQPQRPDIDYSAGDSDLRAILLEPETAPRYSSVTP
jgi:hypothetical protein